MFTPQIKYALKFIFVVIVITGLLASYIFTGVSTPQPEASPTPVQEGFNFTGPGADPAVSGPTSAPGVSGPGTPPRQ